MTELKQEDLVDAPTSEALPVEETVQDPLKTELDKVQKSGKTELEKAQFSLKKNAERLVELGGDPNTTLGIERTVVANEEDDQPVTRAELRKIIAGGATKTALQMADEIQDATERELVKHYLENRISPSGNPQEDMRDARRIVNSIRNEQIAIELARKNPPKTHSSASGVPAKTAEPTEELTALEMSFMKPPFSLSKEQVIKARQG